MPLLSKPFPYPLHQAQLLQRHFPHQTPPTHVCPPVQRIYLDELCDPAQQPIGMSLMHLTLTAEPQMAQRTRQLIDRVQQEDVGIRFRIEIKEVITPIAVYKFASLSREEVEAILGLSLKETRIYQDAKDEGRDEGREEMLAVTVPLLLKAGMTVEQIAQQTSVAVAVIQRIVQQQPS